MNTNTASTEGLLLDTLEKLWYAGFQAHKASLVPGNPADPTGYKDAAMEDALPEVHRYAETMAREELEKLKDWALDMYAPNSQCRMVVGEIEEAIAALASPDGGTKGKTE